MTQAPAPSDAPIRRGSPFAISSSSEGGTAGEDASPSPAVAWQAADTTFDPQWGALQAANWASAWVALCGIACLQLFPGGGVVVAAYGCGLATIGLFSARPLIATILLIIHAGLFFGCYQRLF